MYPLVKIIENFGNHPFVGVDKTEIKSEIKFSTQKLTVTLYRCVFTLHSDMNLQDEEEASNAMKCLC